MTFKISPFVPLSKIFEIMGDLQTKRQIDHFAVTRTTLEQVFIAFARFQHNAAHLTEDPRSGNRNGLNNSAVSSQLSVPVTSSLLTGDNN